MNSLEQRKKLLIAESELNRAQLAQDWQTMADEVRALADQAGTLRSMVSAVTGLIGSLAAFRRKKTTAVADKPSWLQTALKCAPIVASLWSTFNARPKS